MNNPPFNPNNAGIPNGNYFALPYSIEEAEVVLLSVPWDATVSYRAGTHRGPKAMIEASAQIDLYDSVVPKAWEVRIGTLPAIRGLAGKNRTARKAAEEVIAVWERGEEPNPYNPSLSLVNEACGWLHQNVCRATREYLEKGKIVGIVGGEHSVPLGTIEALCDYYPSFGILHIDAHADLRRAYEGFRYSHASIMYHALTFSQVNSLVQVGVRDYCQDEASLIKTNNKIHCFTDEYLHRNLFEGETWKQLCMQVIEKLPPQVYISFDIDGLSPDLCPNTGTPVPGGLSFREADFLLYTLATSGKRIIGFDLCEVAPAHNNEWDANVGARILYKLCCYSHLSQNDIR